MACDPAATTVVIESICRYEAGTDSFLAILGLVCRYYPAIQQWTLHPKIHARPLQELLRKAVIGEADKLQPVRND